MLTSLKKLWSFDRATWFLRLESAEQRCLDFRIAETSHEESPPNNYVAENMGLSSLD